MKITGFVCVSKLRIPYRCSGSTSHMDLYKA